jgi:hypothetical protein
MGPSQGVAAAVGWRVLLARPGRPVSPDRRTAGRVKGAGKRRDRRGPLTRLDKAREYPARERTGRSTGFPPMASAAARLVLADVEERLRRTAADPISGSSGDGGSARPLTAAAGEAGRAGPAQPAEGVAAGPDARLDGQAHGPASTTARPRSAASRVTSSKSARRIDAAVAAVMAHDRAAALAGVTRDSIYI